MAIYKSLELLAQMHIHPELVQKHLPEHYLGYAILLINNNEDYAWRCFYSDMRDEKISGLINFKRTHRRDITEEDIPYARSLAEYVKSTFDKFERSILAETPYSSVSGESYEEECRKRYLATGKLAGVCDSPSDEDIQMLCAPAQNYQPEIITDRKRQEWILLGRECLRTDPKEAYHYFSRAEDKQGIREAGINLLSVNLEYACYAFEEVDDRENLSRVGEQTLESEPALAYRAFTSAEDKEGLKNARKKLVETDLARAYWVFNGYRLGGPKYKKDEDGLVLLANMVAQNREIELSKILQLFEIVPHEADHMSTIFIS